VLRGVSLCIQPDEKVALLGPNGAGKSTLMQVLSGDLCALHRDEPAPVRVFGQRHWSLFDLRARLGIVTRVLEDGHKRDVRGREVLLSGFFGSVGLHEPPTEAMALQALQIARLLGIEALLDTRFDQMSTGEARRFLLGRALVHDPQLLLFDEPYTGLDLKVLAAFSAVVRQLAASGRGIVLVTHALEDVFPEIQRVVLLREGRILADGPKAEMLTSARLSELFDADVEVFETDGKYRARLAGPPGL